MYDLQEQKPYVLIDNTQACNPSITPSSDPAMQNRMIHLNLGIRVGEESYHAHETFGIRDNNDSLLWYIRKPEASGEWQHPEWSTHEDFATCCAGYGGNLSYNDCDYWDVYAIHIPSKATLRITQGGDYDVPHLWVGATSTTIERPSHSPKEFAGGEEKRNAYFHYGNGMINKEGTIRIHSRTNTLQDVTVVTPDGVTVFTHSSNSGLSSQTRCMLSSGVFLLRATTLSGRLFQQVLVVP